MKAIVYSKYGSPNVLNLKEVEKPTPRENEILIKIHAVSLNYADWHLLKGDPFIFRFLVFGYPTPKHPILGSDIAGRVEAVGKNVKQFQPGDAVFGDISAESRGGLAEYVSVSEQWLAPKPENVSFEEAASVPMAAVTALQGLRDKGQIKAGQKVLVNGASGGVGTFAVQIAKSFGTEVTAVCSSRNLDLMHSIGADHVIDYAREDFTKSNQKYDLILAANGYHSLSEYRKSLNQGGIYVCSGGSLAQIFQPLLLGPMVSYLGNVKMSSLAATPSQKDLLCLNEMLKTGKVKPVIDRCYKFSEAVDAFSYLGEGHARGKIVLTI